MNAKNPPQKINQFSGHETFPLRQLWLRKAYLAVNKSQKSTLKNNKGIFSDAEAIGNFGVGKNMALAIRHWSLACNIIEEDTDTGGYKVSPLGEALFGEKGLDKYQEHPSTNWLIHWKLAGDGARSTTWKWLFNNVIDPNFEVESLTSGLESYVKDQNAKAARATLKKDIECCLRSYVPRVAGDSPEETSDSVLGELGLIQQTSRGNFEFKRGPKQTLNNNLFTYCLLDFWDKNSSHTQSMSFDVIAHEYGSPGKVFKLDEASISDRVQSLADVTKGAITWSDTAGISQLIKINPKISKESFLLNAYV